MMDEEQYFARRLDDQIDWYGKKSQWNKNWYKRLRSVEILAAVLIPFLSPLIGTSRDTFHLKLYVSGLGLLVAVIVGIVTLHQFQDLWIQYRTTSESLKHEKFLFLTQTAPYTGGNRFHVLVRRVEALLSQENQTWAQFMQEEDKDRGKPKG